MYNLHVSFNAQIQDGCRGVEPHVSWGSNFVKKNMPKAARKPSSVIDSDVGNTEVMVMKFIELLNDEEVLRKLKSASYPHARYDILDKLTQTIAGLTSQLESKEKRITALEDTLERLEGECDKVEQYSRRNNLRCCGVPETAGEGEDTTAKVVEIISSKMAFTPPPPPPPVSQEDIIVSHRLGKRSDTGDRHRVVIVRFGKVTVRDGVIRARSRLRSTNCCTEQIYVNEDLTQRRAALAAATRQIQNKSTTAEPTVARLW